MSTTEPKTALALQNLGGVALRETESRLNEFRAFVRNVLTDGIDYGVIPGTGKATLLKPGAERICQLYGLAAEFTADVSTEDWSDEPPFFFYRFTCRLVHRASGAVLGEGLGSCNSRESKYGYRVAWGPKDRNEKPEGDGWEWVKGKYGSQWKRRIPNPDTADIANTILKMAKKRAYIDATLTVAAASEFFGQDIEDLPIDYRALAAEDTGSEEIESEAAELRELIKACQNINELQAVAAKIKDRSKAVGDAVRGDYGQRLEHLRSRQKDERGGDS